MTKHEVGQLCSRVLSIWTLIAAISGLNYPVSLLELSSRSQPGYGAITFVLSLIPSILLFVLCAILWFKTEALGTRVTLSSEIDESAGMSPQILQSIVFSFVGLSLLTSVINNIENIAVLISYRTAGERARLAFLIAEVLVKLALGSWLFWGSKSLRRLGAYILNSVNSAFEKDW